MLSVFFSSKCILFHNSNVFGSCIIHILYTGCDKIEKNNSGAKRLINHKDKSVPISITTDLYQPFYSSHCAEKKMFPEKYTFYSTCT